MAEIATFQGASSHTARKEFEIEGVSYMRFNQFKNRHFLQRIRNVICADVFCGTGQNDVGDEIIDGSPIRLLNAFSRAKNTDIKFHFWFSDIRGQACNQLKSIIDALKIDEINYQIHKMSAETAVENLHETMLRSRDTYLFLVLDPNGPKDFPKAQVQRLLSDFSKQIDVVPYISSTSMNRCIAAREKAGIQFKGWLGQIENFDHGFVQALTAHGRHGWIREPIKSDPQHWTMLPTFGCMKPFNDWDKQGFVEINSQRGRDAIKFYCGGIV